MRSVLGVTQGPYARWPFVHQRHAMLGMGPPDASMQKSGLSWPSRSLGSGSCWRPNSFLRGLLPGGAATIRRSREMFGRFRMWADATRPYQVDSWSPV